MQIKRGFAPITLVLENQKEFNILQIILATYINSKLTWLPEAQEMLEKLNDLNKGTTP